MIAGSRIPTPRLILSPISRDDLEDVVQACQDPEISRFTQVPNPYTRQDADAFLDEVVPAIRAEGLEVWSIRLQSGEFVGLIDVHEKQGHSAELGYWQRKEMRGNGFMQEAGLAVREFVQQSSELEFLYCRVATDNVASLRTAKGIGFVFHGIIPGMIFLQGQHRDAHYGTYWFNRDDEVTRLQSAESAVREFHEKFRLPVRTDPASAKVAEVETRLRLLAEECTELIAELKGSAAVSILKEAFAEVEDLALSDDPDVVAVAHELGDAVYVLHGMAVEMNIPLEKVIGEIHRSNMSKLGADGTPVMRSDGKVLKGPDYRKPDIGSVFSG